MKKVLLVLLTLLLLCTLVACGKEEDSDIPDGYMAASDPASDGFVLYLPDTWTIYEDGGMRCGYAASLDRSSVTATSVVSALSPKDYFTASRDGYARTFTDISVEEENEEAADGRAAYSVRFTCRYDGKGYCFYQKIIDGGDGLLFVVTCQASTDVEERLGTSRYAQHETEFADIVAYFAVTGVPAVRPEPSFEGSAPAGMKIASDKMILGCVLCVPESWRITVSSGAVQAVCDDGSNVGLSAMTPTAATVSECFENLLKGYRSIYGEENVRVLAEPGEAEKVGGYPAYRFRLEITRADGVFVTEQLMLLHNSLLGGNAYLLTFTAKADLFDSHTDEFASITEAFSYK